MFLMRPFPGLRPSPDRAAEVVAPPYDVVSEAEARAAVRGRPHSFLRVSRPEVDLPVGTDPYSAAVYRRGAETLAALIANGVLRLDDVPTLSVYRLTLGDHCQTGVIGAASVRAYVSGKIKKHELTRVQKEDDRVRHMTALRAQTGPAFLLHSPDPALANIVSSVVSRPADFDVELDAVRHEVWVVSDAATSSAMACCFEKMPAMYIADGHHRSAAAARVWADRGRPADPDASAGFLAVAFPADSVLVLDYNRVVTDLNGLRGDEFLARLREHFVIEPAGKNPRPTKARQFALYLDGTWHRLSLAEGVALPELDPAAGGTGCGIGDPAEALDVSLLQRLVFDPILGISDPRSDSRIGFVGGIRGLPELARMVDSGAWRAAFAVFPTSVTALMAVSDAGSIMPPKSTWFEPKLADGLVSLVLDDTLA